MKPTSIKILATMVGETAADVLSTTFHLGLVVTCEFAPHLPRAIGSPASESSPASGAPRS